MVFHKRTTMTRSKNKLTWSHYFEILKCDDELEMLLKKPFNENEDEL